MKVISTEALTIKSWCENPEDGAIEQAKNLAKLPFAFRHIALMPDTHQGYGMPIGGVLATKGVIIPNAVGVDIGCGMMAAKTHLKKAAPELLKKWMGAIREAIPVGFNKHLKAQAAFQDFADTLDGNIPPICLREWTNASQSIGTLGGGNHFMEIQKGSDGYIWVMIHSGSRNLGKQVADHYNKLAVNLNAGWYSKVPKEWELAFLPLNSPEGQAYLQEMNCCVNFALANRQLMMDRIADIIGKPFKEKVNIAHNYAAMENHYGQNVMVHRKGATLATANTTGIIPGSQGTKSYIVQGKGNPESFNSCSHGAGRKMGRKEAERTLNLEEEIKQLNDQGIIHAIRNRADLDEAPGSYKDIKTVMEEQKDLVNVVVELSPLAVVKG